jgi:hypothetical protein
LKQPQPRILQFAGRQLSETKAVASIRFVSGHDFSRADTAK